MVAFILPANSASSGYDIDNSVRISGSRFLQLAHGADGTTKTMTFSWWFKQSQITTNRNFFGHSSVDDAIFIRSDDGFSFIMRNAADGIITTNRKFRDNSAWYHIVLAIDTTQGTAANRIKLYVNGVQETSFATATYPDQNTDLTGFNTNTDNQFIGREKGGNYFDGYMAEVYFIDGVAKAPTDFGEVNDNGVWVPIEYSGSYGTNGYFLEFKQTGTSQNSSGIGADTSGNDNHFAVTNLAAVDVTTDTPTNNFCTGNPLDVSGVDNPGDVCTFSEGNTKIVQAGSNNVVGWKASTIGIRNGKWYFELKLPIIDYQVFGVGASTWDGQDGAADNQFSVYIDNGTETFRRGAGVAAAALSVTSSNNDIWMFALDLDSPKLWIGHQGTWLASGDPAAGSNPMSTQAITDTVFIGGSLYTQNDSQILLNTGNPPYANSSSQADDNGYGDFEYDVPAGFYSICTKNLAEYG